ncbi:carbohydrate ABC transporter permease [Microbacterium hydrothermale]|uniref:carbohydrate ABC transporter permease n=1 Tax=Microbacterium hydrothermale TaxID=857427 RepID=UPI00142D2F62|nr:carbohydrate ABC transporter permease [Microbacterium hydrothermale]
MSALIGDVLLAITVLLIVAPFVYTVIASLRPAADITADPLGLPTRITLDNFANAFAKMNYAQGVLSSTVVLLGSLLLTILLGALAAYPLARITRRWTTWTYRLFIAGSTVPIFVLIAPLYLLLRDLGLLNSYQGLILTYAAINLPVAIFFYTSFFRQIPLELEEAAALDGAGAVRTFFVVLFPLLRPITATLATFLTITVWNDLVVPLVFVQNPALKTVMVNAYSLVGSYSLDPSLLFPAALLGVTPLLVVFVILQRQVVAGLTMGAVKS